MLRKVLIGALMLTALLAAPAAAQYADFAITPGTVSVGGNATFQGSGCAPGSTVTITIDGKVMATVTADASGDYNGAFKADMAPGTYTVTATCGNVVRTTPLTVRGVSVTPPTGTGGGSLPRTGSNTNTMALVGAGLLLLGGGAILATRKRTIA
jgi:LPXTG-motif cell wall-anchored protein